MTKREIALELALTMIKSGNFYISDRSNEGTGKVAAEVYNAVYSGLMFPDDESEESQEAPTVKFVDNLKD